MPNSNSRIVETKYFIDSHDIDKLHNMGYRGADGIEWEMVTVHEWGGQNIACYMERKVLAQLIFAGWKGSEAE